MGSGEQIYESLLDMMANTNTIRDPLANIVTETNNLVKPSTNQSRSMKEFSIFILINNPTHSRLKSPKIFLKFKNIKIVLLKAFLKRG